MCSSPSSCLKKKLIIQWPKIHPRVLVALLSDVYVKIMFINPRAFRLEDSVLKRLPHMPLAEGNLWVPSLFKRELLINTTYVLVLIKYQLLSTVQAKFPSRQINNPHTVYACFGSCPYCSTTWGRCCQWTLFNLLERLANPCHRDAQGPDHWSSGNSIETEFCLLAQGALAPGVFLLSSHWRAICLWNLLSGEEHSLGKWI